MNNTNTLFRGILSLVPYYTFNRLSKKYNTDKYAKIFTAYTQFVILLFAQIRGKDSLRDIELAANLRHNKLYHLGVRLPKGLKKSTLGDANARISYEFYEELFFKLLAKFKPLVIDQKVFKFNNRLLSLDASFVELIIDFFPWAKFRATKGAIKLHTMLDVKKQIPEVLVITDGKVHDLMGVTDFSKPEYKEAIIVFDKGYWDIYRFKLLDDYDIFFVTRLKKRVKYAVVKKLNFKSVGVISDHIIRLNSKHSLEIYPKKLRLVTYLDQDTGKTYEFITNIFHLAPGTIALIYKNRWSVEIFFKWIKQNLVIKSFLGTSRNAVFSQIWVAMIYYLLLSYIKSQTKYSGSIRNLSEILNEKLFDDCSILDVISPRSLTQNQPSEPFQLNLFQD